MTVNPNATGLRAQLTPYKPEQSRFTGATGAHNRHYLAFWNGERDPVKYPALRTPEDDIVQYNAVISHSRRI